MEGQQLAALVDQRWDVLQRLLQMTDRQMQAIDGGRMSELMNLLAEKQQPLTDLNEVSEQLRQAVGDDPDSRHWEGTPGRDRCQRRHRECEQMLQRLLELEAESEKTLASSREAIGRELIQQEDARQAASHYSQSAAPSAGSRLDLSSD